MKLLECHYYEDVRLFDFHKCLYHYDLKNGFLKQTLVYVPIIWLKSEECL